MFLICGILRIMNIRKQSTECNIENNKIKNSLYCYYWNVMEENDFFEQQSDLTAAKIKIYRDYIESYLPGLLMTYGTCFIADLFCGAGKNGSENGSPLVLIDRLKYILSSPHVKKKSNLNINILFNDRDEENVSNLIKELDNISYNKSLINIEIKNEKYEKILPKIIGKYKRSRMPKFFFLDPYKYSNVKMQHLRELMSLSATEVLLFIPIFHSYRFSSVEFDTKHKTRIFIEEFTQKGVTNYINTLDFMCSVREKLLQEISLKYVRPVLLDAGGSKNSLLLLTKHQKGMLLMNKIAIKITEDGSRVNVKNQKQGDLFSINERSEEYYKFKTKLTKQLHQKEMTNKEIIDFTIQELFRPEDANKELKQLYKLQKIKIFDNNNCEINDIRKWNIAARIKKTTVFKWTGDE